MTTDAADQNRQDQAERIQLAAEREAARDRRVFWVYVALACVPLILAGVFLASGRTDRKMLQDEIAPIKTQIAEVQPALQEVKQLGALVPQVRALGGVASQITGTLATVEEQGRELERLKDTTATIVASQEESRKFEEALTALRTQVATLKNDQDVIQRNQAKLQSDVGEIMKRRPVGDVDVDSLVKRLSVLEGNVTAIRRDQIRK